MRCCTEHQLFSLVHISPKCEASLIFYRTGDRLRGTGRRGGTADSSIRKLGGLRIPSVARRPPHSLVAALAGADRSRIVSRTTSNVKTLRSSYNHPHLPSRTVNITPFVQFSGLFVECLVVLSAVFNLIQFPKLVSSILWKAPASSACEWQILLHL